MTCLPLIRALPLLLALLLALRVPVVAAAADTAPAEELPPGVVQKGTLANQKLLADTAIGVRSAAAALGIDRIERAQPYVMQLPQGEPGSRAWTEKWIVFQGPKSAAIDIRFVEDGAGAATWSIEVPQKAPDQDNPADDTEQQPFIAAAQEFVRQAQAGNVDRMIALTSPETIRNSDRQQLKESYRKYVVPRFKTATVRWVDAHAPATDENGNRGWDVAGDAEGVETFSFFITVMKEKGKHVVVTLGRRDLDDPTQ